MSLYNKDEDENKKRLQEEEDLCALMMTESLNTSLHMHSYEANLPASDQTLLGTCQGL